MKTVVLLFLSLIPVLTLSQITFEKIYPNGNGNCVKQTIDGGFIIAGYSLDGFYRGYLIKTDQYGDTVWTKKYYDEYSILFSSVLQLEDGGYAITGRRTNDFPHPDVCLFRTDSFGDTLWTKNYGGEITDEGACIQPTFDGGYIIVGNTNKGTGGSDYYLIRTDDNGDSLWTKVYSLDYDHPIKDSDLTANFVRQTSDSGFIIVGSYSLPAPLSEQSNSYIIKTDEYGDTLWTKSYDIGYNENCLAVHEIIDDEGYIVSGGLYDLFNGYQFLMRINNIGDTLWTKKYRGNEDAGAGFCQLTNDGGYILVGFIQQTNSAHLDVYLIKTDEYGDTLWTRRFGSEVRDWGKCVQITNDGGYIITGYTNGVNNDRDLYIIKTNNDGNVTWQREFTNERLINPGTIPNPFTSSTTLSYELKQPEKVSLSIYNHLGQIVYQHSEAQQQGSQQLQWDAKDQAEGLYYFSLQVGNAVANGKMVKVR